MTNEAAKLELTAQELEGSIGERLDVVIATKLQRSRGHAQDLLKNGYIHLLPPRGELKASYRLRRGDAISIMEILPIEVSEEPAGENIPLDIVYQDEDLLALNKGAGLVVHPGSGHRTGTLVNALIHHQGTQLARRGGAERMGLVHRLDKDTSGLILIAKTDVAHERLALAFAERKVRKFYRALCWGVFRRRSGECREAIGRHRVHRQKMHVMKTGGRASHTDYRVLMQGQLGAEVECLLHTGRTHQIRVHLAHLGHPIWGDLIYGRPHATKDGFTPTRQMLHAVRLEIQHPITGEPLVLEAPLPQDYLAAREQLAISSPKI